jgi:hypothetical protein
MKMVSPPPPDIVERKDERIIRMHFYRYDERIIRMHFYRYDTFLQVDV